MLLLIAVLVKKLCFKLKMTGFVNQLKVFNSLVTVFLKKLSNVFFILIIKQLKLSAKFCPKILYVLNFVDLLFIPLFSLYKDLWSEFSMHTINSLG